jgi:hypothetical protein
MALRLLLAAVRPRSGADSVKEIATEYAPRTSRE